MRRTAFMPLVVIFAFGLVLSLGACSSDKPKPDDKASGSGGSGTVDCQGCADCKKAGKGWCDKCSAGYCDGKKTSCSICAKAGKFDDGCAASQPKVCSECSAKMK